MIIFAKQISENESREWLGAEARCWPSRNNGPLILILQLALEAPEVKLTGVRPLS